jgi:hypothetical protein
MARIVRTTPPAPRKTFLLKAGLSIFLFLQIQVPVFQEQLLAKAHNLPLNLQTKLTQNAYKVVAKTDDCALVALAEKVK